MFKSNRDRNRILDCSLYLSINIQNYRMCLRRTQFNAVIQKTAVLIFPFVLIEQIVKVTKFKKEPFFF